MTLQLRSLEEFFTDPKPCNALQHVREWQASQEGIEWEARENLRLLGVWNNLGQQIVGAEDPSLSN